MYELKPYFYKHLNIPSEEDYISKRFSKNSPSNDYKTIKEKEQELSRHYFKIISFINRKTEIVDEINENIKKINLIENLSYFEKLLLVTFVEEYEFRSSYNYESRSKSFKEINVYLLLPPLDYLKQYINMVKSYNNQFENLMEKLIKSIDIFSDKFTKNKILIKYLQTIKQNNRLESIFYINSIKPHIKLKVFHKENLLLSYNKKQYGLIERLFTKFGNGNYYNYGELWDIYYQDDLNKVLQFNKDETVSLYNLVMSDKISARLNQRVILLILIELLNKHNESELVENIFLKFYYVFNKVVIGRMDFDTYEDDDLWFMKQNGSNETYNKIIEIIKSKENQ